MYVYVIGPKDGPFKIGITKDLNKRRESFQTASAIRIHVHAARQCADRAEARALEELAHQNLRRYRLTGEWFACVLEDAMSAVGATDMRADQEYSIDLYENLLANLRHVSPEGRKKLAEHYGIEDDSPEGLARHRANEISSGYSRY